MSILLAHPITLNSFPTHVAKTDNKFAPNKYWKINSQGIYSGTIKTFTRATVVRNMHKYIIDEFNKRELPKIDSPVQIKIDIYIPINYGDVRRRSKDGSISWKAPTEDYEPSADEDNIRWIWEKCIKDCVSKTSMWKDDNMYWCRGSNTLVHFIDNLDDRKIEVNFIKI